jgi:MSHA biogenesis protein MshJ
MTPSQESSHLLHTQIARCLTYWHSATTYIDGMSLRERIILTGMCSVLLIVLFQLLWADRVDAQRKLLSQQLDNAATANHIIWQQAEALRLSHISNPNDQLKNRLKQLQADVTAAEQKLEQAADELAQPRNVPLLLRNLVGVQPGLVLRRVETLAVTMVDINGKLITDSAGIEDGALYRHGLEVEITGSFLTLNRWLVTIEKVPGYIQWESMQYVVEPPLENSGPPQAKLILRLYTLSLQEVWLSV